MAGEDTQNVQAVWTVGHSNHPLEQFFGLLIQHEIAVLADVRSQPYSRYTPHFNAESLKMEAALRGLRYTFFGDTLGGRPNGDEFYDDEGHVRYDCVAETSFFQEGIIRMERGVARGVRIALMCSEENPSVCHRHVLIGRVLARRGVTLYHIRGDGAIQTDADLERMVNTAAAVGQESLFGEEEESRPWRSIPSVLPKRVPKTSSSG